jgi:aminopeptidase N
MKKLQMNKVLLLLISILITACSTSQKVVEAPVEYEERILDTMMVVAPKVTAPEPELVLDPYRPSAKRTIDLLHTKLNLKFDWTKQHVMGVANLKFEPLFYPIQNVSFDAVGFDIHKVLDASTNQPLKYSYDGLDLNIDLSKEYSKGEVAEILIDYTAKPEELLEGGSAAITSDKGLFFINPLGEDPDKPMQIWTQGETENNSRWFPTIDKPNERTTQEMYLTVQDKYKTLSNGILVSSTKNSDGTRTDYWNMNKPHAPYLFMLAIGEFAKVDDQWEDIPLAYYVEAEYEEDADKIFDNTPEMLAFFSDYLGVKYPWDKYSQIIVRDYVSGAMENTTGVIFGDFVQKKERELIDNSNDYIVAHEMFHHWFGDYVTCESWSNLTMNEGFANYSEYLWEEHHQGKQAADYLRSNELRGYLGSAQNQGTHDLINFEYDDKEEMFDAHSYNKGGLVLHMLRNYVGEEAFRASLNKYLTDNAYTAVEAHDLRLAFEAVTGEDLNWFFNQWYFDKGHPELELIHGYTDGVYSLRVNQTQDPISHRAIFELPVKVDIYMADGSKTTENIWVNERQQTFEFKVSEKPAFVNFDADNIILGKRIENLSIEENIFQYKNASAYQDRADAINALRGEPQAKQVFIDALDDPFFSIRRVAVTQINPNNDVLINKIKDLALKDAKSQVRMAAINKLTEISDPKLASFASEILENEQAYPAYAAALNLLYTHDPDQGLKTAETLMNETNYDLVSALSDIFSMTSDKKYLSFYESKIENLGGFNSYPVFGSYAAFLQNLSDEDLAESLGFLIKTGKSNSANFKRFMATSNLNNIGQSASSRIDGAKSEEEKKILQQIVDDVYKAIDEIVEMEENPQLLERYKAFGRA